MNTNFYVIHKTPKTHFATTVCTFKQLFTAFPTAQITQIKKIEKISNIKHSFVNQNGAKVVRTIFNGSNDLTEKENASIIDITIEYSTITEKFKAPLL